MIYFDPPYGIVCGSSDDARLEAEQIGRIAAVAAVYDRRHLDQESERRSQTAATGVDLHKGFVYRRVPHFTLKAIANNEEIDALHAERQPQLDAALTAVNAAAGTNWREWEVPRALSASHPEWSAAGGQRGRRAVEGPRQCYGDEVLKVFEVK